MRACRTCLSRHDLSPLFAELGFSSDQLFKATGIKISQDDGLPQAACEHCIRAIRKTLQFHEICSKAEEYFKSLASHNNVKIESDDYENPDYIIDKPINPLPDNISIENNDKDDHFNIEIELQNDMKATNYLQNNEHNKHVNLDNERNSAIKTNYSIDNNLTTINSEQINTQTNTKLNQETNHNKINIINDKDNIRQPKINVKCVIQRLGKTNNIQNSTNVCNVTNSPSTSNKNYDNIKTEDNSNSMKIEGHINSNTDNRRIIKNDTKSTSYQMLEVNRSNFMNNLLKNVKERKMLIMAAQRRIQSKLQGNEVIKKYTKNKIKIAKTKCSRVKEKNKKLMALAVTPHPSSGPIKCSICSNMLRNKATFKAHARTHFQAEFTCQVCGKSFAQRPQLIRHQRCLGHGAEKQLSCPHCSFTAAQAYSMRNHIRALHTGEKPFECNECGMKFRMRNNIIQHLTIHFGVKNVQCELCASRFKRKSELWSHQQKTHFNYIHTHYCYLCPKTYRHVKDARKHIVKVHGIPLDQQPKIQRVKTKKDESEVSAPPVPV